MTTTMFIIDDIVRKATERIAERDGCIAAVREGARLRAMLVRRMPATAAEAMALAEQHLRDGDR